MQLYKLYEYEYMNLEYILIYMNLEIRVILDFGFWKLINFEIFTSILFKKIYIKIIIGK